MHLVDKCFIYVADDDNFAFQLAARGMVHLDEKASNMTIDPPFVNPKDFDAPSFAKRANDNHDTKSPCSGQH